MSKGKKSSKMFSEMRAFSMPDLTASAEGNIIDGHAAVFGQEVIIGGYYKETIERGAFDKTDLTDVLFSVNHDLDKIPLARSRNNNVNSTLQLKIDDSGLYTKAELDIENNSEAKSLYSAVKRGDINGMSFIFRVSKDEWTGLDTDMPSRSILEISKVYEVSAVSFPAYDGTDINARSVETLESAKRALENARAKELDSSGEHRELDSSEDIEERKQAIQKLAKINYILRKKE